MGELRIPLFLLYLSTSLCTTYNPVTAGRIRTHRRPHHHNHKPVHDQLPGHLRPSDSREVYARVPSYDTYEFLAKEYGFICHDKASGYYGDANYECRIFHVCHSDGRRDTFFCPALTRFNNNLQICDWQHKVDHRCSPLYHIPADISGRQTYILPSLHELYPVIHNRKPLDQQLGHASEEKIYRNKYQEQEYYQSVYSHQAPRLKFLLETQVPGPIYTPSKPNFVRLPSQPVFSYPLPPDQPAQPEVNVLIAHATDFQQDSSPSRQHESHDDGPASKISEGEVDHETERQEEKSEDDAAPAAAAAVSKYGAGGGRATQSVIAIPPPVLPVNDDLLLQSPPSRHDGTEGKGGATVGATAGSGHTPKVDSQLSSSLIQQQLGREYEDGAVIELWIPTRVKKISV